MVESRVGATWRKSWFRTEDSETWGEGTGHRRRPPLEKQILLLHFCLNVSSCQLLPGALQPQSHKWMLSQSGETHPILAQRPQAPERRQGPCSLP